MTRTTCVVCLSATLALAGGVSSQEVAGRLEGEKVVVSLDPVGTPLAAATIAFGSMRRGGLVAGESSSLTLAVYGVHHTGCGSATRVAENPEETLRKYPLVYTASFRVLEAELDEIRVALDWKRYTKPGGARRPSAGDQFEVTLKEGQRMVVDVIDRPAYLNPQCAGRNFMLEMTPSIQEDPALAVRQIAYDLWLVHDQPNGRRTTSAWKATGKQGQKLAFQFPEGLLSGPTQAPGDSEPILKLSITGEIRGRLRQNGSLDVSVDLDQQLILVDRTSSTGRAEGMKRLRIQAGETIRIDIPLAKAPTGPSSEPDRFQQCLTGHTLGLILTATPLE